MTVAERDRKMKQQKKEESEARKEKEERRREALKLVEETIRSEQRNAQVWCYVLKLSVSIDFILPSFYLIFIYGCIDYLNTFFKITVSLYISCSGSFMFLVRKYQL